MVHHRSARPEMEAAWRRKAAYADKDTSIFLMISEEYDVKKVQQWIFSPVTEVRYHEAAIDTEQTRGNDKAKADARTPRPTKIERTPKPRSCLNLHHGSLQGNATDPAKQKPQTLDTWSLTRPHAKRIKADLSNLRNAAQIHGHRAAVHVPVRREYMGATAQIVSLKFFFLPDSRIPAKSTGLYCNNLHVFMSQSNQHGSNPRSRGDQHTASTTTRIYTS